MADRELFLLQIMAVFTGVAAIALLLMMGFMFAIMRAMHAVRERALQFMDRWEPLADTSQKSLEEFQVQSKDILADVKKLTASGQSQMERIDSMVGDLHQSAKTQMDRVDSTLVDTLRRVEETTEAVQQTILVPVRQVRAVAAGVDAVLRHLVGRRRPTVDQATIDEEMFI